jgi:hypothetical protein
MIGYEEWRAEREHALAATHAPVGPVDDDEDWRCLSDGDYWPCPTHDVLAQLRELRKHKRMLDRLRPAARDLLLAVDAPHRALYREECARLRTELHLAYGLLCGGDVPDDEG